MKIYIQMRRSERIAGRFLKARDTKGFRAAWRRVMKESAIFEHEPVRRRADVVLKVGQAALCLEDGDRTECLGPLLRSLAVPDKIDAAWLRLLRARLSIIEEYPDTEYPSNLLRSILAGAKDSKLN